MTTQFQSIQVDEVNNGIANSTGRFFYIACRLFHLAFVGIAANFATSKLFSLLTLSDLYAAATTTAQKSQFLAVGQATLAVGALGGIGGSVEGGIPLAIAGLIISVIMLRSNILGRAAVMWDPGKWDRIGDVLQCGLGPSHGRFPFFGVFFLLSVIWFVLIGLRLIQISRGS